MREKKVVGVILGIFLFILIFIISGCGGGFAISSTGDNQNYSVTGNLKVKVIPDSSEVNIIDENYQEYGIKISDGILERSLPTGKYTLEFLNEQYGKRTSLIEIKPNNSVDFTVDFTQPLDEKL